LNGPLEENEELKSQLFNYKGVLYSKMKNILNALRIHESDITNLRIKQSHTEDEAIENGGNIASNLFSAFNHSQT